MREYGQERNGQSGRAASEGPVRRNEKKVLLDIACYRRDLDNCDAFYDEFSKYRGEPNCMRSRIQKKIKQILKIRPLTGFDPDRGWLLARRSACYKYIPDRGCSCTVTKYDEIYYLSTNGGFSRYTYEFQNGWNLNNKGGKWYNEKDWKQQDVPLDEVVEVFDFHVYGRQTVNFRKEGRDHEWFETHDIISKFSSYWWENATVKAERLYAQKGVGLYRLLWAVLNESDYYERIYAKINSRLSEIARDKQTRTDKWDEKVQKTEATRDERKPVGLLERISSFFS